MASVGLDSAPGIGDRRARLRVTPWPPSWVAKVVMAVTGVVFAAFVLVHMIGNLKVYAGADSFDGYAHWLRTVLMPLFPREGVLWLFRATLLSCLVLHVWCALLLVHRGRISRGRPRRRGLGWRSFAARTMPVTGVVLLAFIVFHILDLTTGNAPAATDGFVAGAAHANLVASFSRPWSAAFYMLAMVVLFLHLVHGLWTVVTDFGATGRRTRAFGAAVAGVVPLAVMVGNMSIPVAVLAGWVS